MITRIEALNYQCLQYVSRAVSQFHVLVGPNASGKTTFLDVVGFMRDLVFEGMDGALANRTNNPEEIIFRREGKGLEMALEARIPDGVRSQGFDKALDTARYEVAIGFDETMRQFEFKSERFLIKKRNGIKTLSVDEFPSAIRPPATLMTSREHPRHRVIVENAAGPRGAKKATFFSEINENSGQGAGFKLGSGKSAFANMPDDEIAFPAATWFREFLKSGVQRFMLNSLKIRRPSPPTKVKGFLPDGSNLPWVVARLRRENMAAHQQWIAHLQTVLDDLVDIHTIERPEDRHCYLVYEYRGGLKVPSWLVSDGTLRLTALTIPAYIIDFKGIYMVEEPENGIHPRAVATVYDSLSSVYEAQVLLATHSPVILNAARLEDVLCFARDEQGATDIVSGPEHPRLRQWRGGTDLGTLLAAGVLG